MWYCEWGWGNPTFASSEFQFGRSEVRVPCRIRVRHLAWYVRVWVGRTVWVWDTVQGWKRSRKSRRAFKLLLGERGD